IHESKEPGHSQHVRILKSNYALVHERAQWNARVREVWDRVRFVDSGPAPEASVTSGKPMPVRAIIDLAGLKPDDVRVEVVVGQIDTNGHLEDTEVMVLPPVEQQGAVAVFGKDIIPERTGRLGYA